MSRVVELLCSRRVPQVAALALMSFGFAGCSADMSTRLSQNSFSNPFASQPEATGSVPAVPRSSAANCRNIPGRNRKYQSQALPPPIAAPQTYPAASQRRVRRRARARLLRSAGASDRDHRHRRAALGRGDPRAGPGRHHDHRRHQRHARDPGAPLPCLASRDPAGQRLQGAAHAVAGPAADHSARRPPCRRAGAASRRAPATRPVAAASAPPAIHCRQSRRYAAQHRPPQPRIGRRTGERQ